jgi:uncharacterized membrane protein
MNASYVIIGLIAGVFIGAIEGSFLLGMVGGGMVGMALGRLVVLEKRVRELEWRSRPAESVAGPPATEPVQDEPLPERPVSPWTEFEPNVPEAAAEPGDTALQGLAPGEGQAPPAPAAASRRPARTPAGPSLAQRAIDRVTAWFTTGNVPVKIGVIVTFIGVSFLLKYAVDHELIVFPIEFRLLAVAAGGLALIVIGWRLREKTRTYALSLQGGGAGIMFLTIFAAFRIWDLLPALPAFVLLVAMAFFTGALAVLQNARSLAILGIAGGFLAPILASTGQGSHVVLFSYYLVLNAAILGIAWFRAWRELNLLGFVFTFVIGGFWGFQYYRQELWASTQPFLVLHFLFYNAIAVLYALRQPPEKLGVVDGTLVFGTPVICSALQAALMQGTEYGLAISAAAAAVYYALLATWLFRNRGEYLRLMTESFIALAVAFATLAIPLALDARWTSAAWALEGAALVWVGARQQRQLAKFAGVLLIIASGPAFLEHGWRAGQGLPVLNGNVLGGVLIALSAMFASRRLQGPAPPNFEPAQKLAAGTLFAWGALWWLGTGQAEIFERVARLHAGHVHLVFLAASFGAAGWLGRARQWLPMRYVSLLMLPGILVLALQQAAAHEHLLREAGWLAWPLAWVVQVYLLRLAENYPKAFAGAWHAISLLLLTGMLALEASWWVGQAASTAWAATAATAVLGTAALLVWRFRERPAWPVPAHQEAYLRASLALVTVQVVVLVLLAIDKPGNPEPLPYIPLLNPYDLAALYAAVTALLSLRVLRVWHDARFDLLAPYRLLLAAAFLVLTTATLVRGVHFYANVPWTGDALFGSVVVQTSLSIYWGLLGFAGMILGARGRRRAVWMAGAGFMALVVLKLFLVDLGNTGTVERIISFIGIGALLLVVGYLAPAPPRSRAQSESGEESP